MADELTKGFTLNRACSGSGQVLVEIVFSIGIVGVILSGLIVAVVYAQKATRLARERTEAGQLAQQKIESLRAEENNDHDLFWSKYYEGYDNTEENLGENEKFDRRTRVPGIVGSQPNRRAEIQVIVSWPDGDQTRDVTLNSYITEY